MQLVTQLIGGGICLALATIYDLSGRSMSWYSNHWIVFGIYLCPLLFVLGTGPAVYIVARKRWFTAKRPKTTTTTSYLVQMFLHAQCFLFSLIGLVLTISMWKSAFIFVLPVAFATVTTLINLSFKLCHHGKYA